MPVTVLGTGTIGATVAYTLATETSGVTIRLTDIDEGKSRGHAIDITHSTAHVAHAIGHGRSGDGGIEAVPPGPDAVAGADCIVVTASAPRPDGASQRGGRMKWLEGNLDIVRTVGDWLQSTIPCPVVVVTNPLDVLTYELYRQSGWPRGHFVGYSLSETARLADALARDYNVAPAAVHCPVLGMHGEHLVPIFSRATIRGDTIDLDEPERQRLLDYIRQVPFTVMDLRGAGESSRWVTGRGAALVVQTLLDGGLDEPVGLSTPLESEYGYEDVALSVPVTLEEAGVEQIVEWDLSRWEQAQLDEACRAVAATIPD